MKIICFFFLFLLLSESANAQEPDYSLRNPDSLLVVLSKKMTFWEFAEFKKTYDEGDDKAKEFSLLMNSLPKSSKVKLVSNLEKNKDSILLLVERFKDLVPEGYSIDVEFPQMYKFMKTQGVVEIKVYKNEGKDDKLLGSGEMLMYNSPQLSSILKHVNWTDDTLREIESLLNKAGCIGINNIKAHDEREGVVEINFSQSGLGMYSYLIFPNILTLEEIQEYNDGCLHIYYKDNIVLSYGGGAVGRQCFEKDLEKN